LPSFAVFRAASASAVSILLRNRDRAAAGNCQDTVGEPVRSGRNRWFLDSPLEGDGFELLVPPRRKLPSRAPCGFRARFHQLGEALIPRGTKSSNPAFLQQRVTNECVPSPRSPGASAHPVRQRPFGKAVLAAVSAHPAGPRNERVAWPGRGKAADGSFCRDPPILARSGKAMILDLACGRLRFWRHKGA
jgi:hypothetical protein